MAVDPDLASKLFINIGQLWMKEKFSDLTISVGDYQFHCHKFHLCAVSEFFNILLGNDGTDGCENTLRHAKISGISPEIFGMVLKAVYKGENCVDENNVIQVWHAAHELQIDVLVSKCEDFVMANMTLDNYENIYHSSVLLESARVTDFVLDFIAKHFRQISKTSLFLELPSKFLVSIVNSGALVVESRECLVDSILFWANLKSENDDEESGNNNAVVNSNDSQREIQCGTSETEAEKPTSASYDPVAETKRDKQCVEIMFSQPLAGLEDESTRRTQRQILQETGRREETLGKLLNLANLEQTGPDYLKSLVDNDWLMGIKDARKVVWEARDKQLSANFSPNMTNVVADSAGDKTDCEDVFIYKVKGSDTIVAHPWPASANKRYDVTPYMNTYLNTYFEYLSPTYSTPPTFVERQQSGKTDVVCKIGKTELIPGPRLEGASLPVLVGDFLYCFKENAIYRKPHLHTNENVWLCVANVKFDFLTKPQQNVTVYEDQLVLLYGYVGVWEKRHLKVYIFNTAYLTLKFIGDIHDCDIKNCRFVTLNNDDQLHIILKNDGRVWKVNLACDPGNGLVEETKGKNPIFPFVERLYSVASQEKQLIIFADFLQDKLSLPKFYKDFGLHLTFYQVMPKNGQCYRARIPTSWLQKEV